MKRILGFALMLLYPLSIALAQKGNGCHVYIIDIAAAEKVGPMGCSNDKDESKCGVTTFPEFQPDIGEEVSTTKSYKFPTQNLMITANVFFTDEMLASSEGPDSAMISITVAPKTLEKVFSDENSAVAEFSVAGGADAMRVKRFYRLQRKSYLVGLECHFKKLDLR